MAKDNDALLAIARKRVVLDRDEMGRTTKVHAPKDWNIGGLIPNMAPFSFSMSYYKDDGAEGTWVGYVYQNPSDWVWLNNNNLIIQLQTGGRIESSDGNDFRSTVHSGDSVSETKFFTADGLIDEFVECFEKGLDVKVRVGFTDFTVSSSYLAFLVAIKELVEQNEL